MRKLVLLLITVGLFYRCIPEFHRDIIKESGTQKTENRKPGHFTKISIIGPYKVTLVQEGGKGSLTVQTDENFLPYIITKVKGDVLEIKTKHGYELTYKQSPVLKITVDKLEAVDITGSGILLSKETLNQDSIDLSVMGSGDIELPLSSAKVNASVTGSGTIVLEGESHSAKYEVTGSGTINSEKLKSGTVEADITGSGEIYLYARDSLKSNITGSGTIYHSGTSKVNSSNILGSGNIINK